MDVTVTLDSCKLTSVRFIGHMIWNNVVNRTEESGKELWMCMTETRQISIIAVDFDGTLCSDCYPNIGEPNLPLIVLLQRLQKQGKQIILWTCRCGKQLQEAVDWCSSFGLQFDAVNENVRQTLERYGTESRKISADVYIDDKACYPWEYFPREYIPWGMSSGENTRRKTEG